MIYLAIPDKRETFDRLRPNTPFAHVVKDDAEGPAGSRREHFLEYAHLVEHAPPGIEQSVRADHLMEIDYSIHFHVWDKPAVCEFVGRLAGDIGLPFDPIQFRDNGLEAIWILRKTKGQQQG